MTFDDLPDDWSDRPLTDPALVADVLDLVSSRATVSKALSASCCATRTPVWSNR
jgi:hypothetical protein